MKADEPITGQVPGNSPDGDELSRLLEIELIQKRAAWERTIKRNKNLKSVSILFLMLVVLGGLAAFYFVYMQASEGRQQRPAQTVETPTRR